MKKLVIILFCFVLCGCSAPVRQQANSRLVTAVVIETEGQRWEYTNAQKVTAVLDYLRFLPKSGAVLLDPTQVDTQAFTIRLTYMDGSERTYVQRGFFYLSRDQQPFQAIDPACAQELLTLLGQYPSD